MEQVGEGEEEEEEDEMIGVFFTQIAMQKSVFLKWQPVIHRLFILSKFSPWLKAEGKPIERKAEKKLKRRISASGCYCKYWGLLLLSIWNPKKQKNKVFLLFVNSVYLYHLLIPVSQPRLTNTHRICQLNLSVAY